MCVSLRDNTRRGKNNNLRIGFAIEIQVGGSHGRNIGQVNDVRAGTAPFHFPDVIGRVDLNHVAAGHGHFY